MLNSFRFVIIDLFVFEAKEHIEFNFILVLSTLQSDLIGVEAELAEVERKLSVAFWRRNLGYPLMLLLLLATTCLCVFLVGINLIALALGQTSLPFVQDKQQSAGTTTLDSAIHRLLSLASLDLRRPGGWLNLQYLLNTEI